ncbi:MAG: hypothetical protein AAB557_00200 [Patescibacteria group bacterium]
MTRHPELPILLGLSLAAAACATAPESPKPVLVGQAGNNTLVQLYPPSAGFPDFLEAHVDIGDTIGDTVNGYEDGLGKLGTETQGSAADCAEAIAKIKKNIGLLSPSSDGHESSRRLQAGKVYVPIDEEVTIVDAKTGQEQIIVNPCLPKQRSVRAILAPAPDAPKISKTADASQSSELPVRETVAGGLAAIILGLGVKFWYDEKKRKNFIPEAQSQAVSTPATNPISNLIETTDTSPTLTSTDRRVEAIVAIAKKTKHPLYEESPALLAANIRSALTGDIKSIVSPRSSRTTPPQPPQAGK